MKVYELQAGRELDALVAEKVMGWRDIREETEEYPTELGWQPHTDFKGQLPTYKGDDPKICRTWIYRYSTNIEMAWMVVEHITKSLDELITDEGEKYGYWTLDRLGYDCCQDGNPDVDNCHGQWRCWFSCNKSDEERLDCHATGDTPMMAICLAALLSVGAIKTKR